MALRNLAEAAQLGTHPTVIQLWLNGTAIGRKASVKRIKAFLEERKKRSDRAHNAGADKTKPKGTEHSG